MSTPEMDTILRDINARMESIGKVVEPAALEAMVRGALDKLLENPSEDLKRKMRFGRSNDTKIVGTKYARHGLDISDIEWLYDIQTTLAGQRKAGGGIHEGPSEELSNTFRAVSDAYYLSDAQVKEMDRRAIDDMFPRIPVSWFNDEDKQHARDGKFELTGAYKRAMDTATAGEGQEFVGAGYIRDMWTVARNDSRIFSLLQTFEMTDPTMFLPFEIDIPEMMFVSEATSDSQSDYSAVTLGSKRTQVDAKKFIIHQYWSGEMDEDSLIPFVPYLREQANKSLAFYSDHTVLNGDTVAAGTGNINSDDAAPAATKAYLAFNGIRKAGLIDNTANAVAPAGASLTFDDLINLRGLMIDSTRYVNWGKPVDPNDLVYVTDSATADKIALLSEMKTVDKYGQGATILTGEQGKIGRHPLIETMTLGLFDADGKYTTTSPSTNNTKGSVTAFNRNGVKVGWRRRVKVETERLPGRDQTRMIYSLRMGMGRYTPTGAVGGQEWAAVLYNI